MKAQNLFHRSQPLPRTAERQLNPKRRGEENVDFAGLDFLKIAGGDFGAFRQFILRQTFAHPLPAHIGAEGLNPLPFFFGNCHDILHRFLMVKMNDTYIVKRFPIVLACLGRHLGVFRLKPQFV